MAPAITVDLYHSTYLPVLQRKYNVRVNDLTIYNLKDGLERDDNVGHVYHKSLLYLVSNAFERADEKPLLGMEKFAKLVTTARSLPSFIYSNGVDGQRTRSTSHGGFDNDSYTMNHILGRVLGRKPDTPFTGESLRY